MGRSASHNRLAATVLLVFITATAGCLPGMQETTPTANPTLLAIEAMLTATRAVPTATLTPVPTSTAAVTPSQTVEIPVTGSRNQPGRVGEIITLDGHRLAVLTPTRQETAGQLKAAEGNTFLDVEVWIENAGEQPVTYTPFFFRLTGAGEQVVEAAVDALPPALLSGELEPGEYVRGHVAFEIPAAQEDFLLSYSPVAENGAPAAEPIWIDLGRRAPGSPDLPAGRDWPAEDLTPAGGWQEASGVELRVGEVTVAPRLETLRAAEDHQLVIVQVTIKNAGHDRLPYNPQYFRVKDARGYEYLPSAGLPETSLPPGSLGPGQTVQGQLIFETPLESNRFVLTHLPTVLFQEFEPIEFLIETG